MFPERFTFSHTQFPILMEKLNHYPKGTRSVYMDYFTHLPL